MTTFIIHTTFGTDIIVKAENIQQAVMKCCYDEREIEYVKEVLTTKTYVLTPTWIQLIQSQRTMENV